MSVAASRARHLAPALAMLALAAAVAWLGFTREPAGAYLFPRLISGVMLALASWNLARAALGPARAEAGTGEGFDAGTLRRAGPGVAVALAYALFAAKALGFYVASYLAFVALHALYDRRPHDRIGSWARRFALAFAVLFVVHALFAWLLRVQTPRGLFF